MFGDTLNLPHKVAFTLEKYHQREPDGHPDAVTTTVTWYAADGTEITDPARIEELEAGATRQKGAHDGIDERDA